MRLHSARPGNKAASELLWADWATTVAGGPVRFQARAITEKGSWNGPISPGVAISPPIALDDPWWTVFLPGGRGVPIVADRVGHRLGVGESFTLAPGDDWTEGVVFDGAIVTE
jgi:hypothetical protein